MFGYVIRPGGARARTANINWSIISSTSYRTPRIELTPGLCRVVCVNISSALSLAGINSSGSLREVNIKNTGSRRDTSWITPQTNKLSSMNKKKHDKGDWYSFTCKKLFLVVKKFHIFYAKCKYDARKWINHQIELKRRNCRRPNWNTKSKND